MFAVCLSCTLTQAASRHTKTLAAKTCHQSVTCSWSHLCKHIVTCCNSIELNALQHDFQVREELQRLPGAPTQISRLFGLYSRAAELKQKAAVMEAKTVPRPDPPHYTPLWQNVHRFLAGLGSLDRITQLLSRLMVRMLAFFVPISTFQLHLRREHRFYKACPM